VVSACAVCSVQCARLTTLLGVADSLACGADRVLPWLHVPCEAPGWRLLQM
jgi:hypothetical protein